MIVVVAPTASGEPGLSLEQADDCGRFHLEARCVDRAEVAAALAAAGAGWLSGEDDTFIAPAALERMATGQVGPDWSERFAGMLAYADKKGWTGQDGAIQAHIQWT